jgi:hypothetical protein
MGGQDRRHGEALDERVELAIGTTKPAQPAHRVADRVVEDAVARRSLAPAQCPYPSVRLRQVDQAEVERERTDHGFGRARSQAAQIVVEAGTLCRVVVAAEGDRAAPDPFDEREELWPGLFRDDLAEQGAKQPDLDRKRITRAGRPDAARFGPRRPPMVRGARGFRGLNGPPRLARSAPNAPPRRNLSSRQPSVGLYGVGRDLPSFELPIPRRPDPARRGRPAASGADQLQQLRFLHEVAKLATTARTWDELLETVVDRTRDVLTRTSPRCIC